MPPFRNGVSKFDVVVLKFNPAVMKFNLGVMEFHFAVMKFDFAVMKLDLAVMNFRFIVPKWQPAFRCGGRYGSIRSDASRLIGRR